MKRLVLRAAVRLLETATDDQNPLQAAAWALIIVALVLCACAHPASDIRTSDAGELVDWCHSYHVDPARDRAALCIFTVDQPKDGGRR